MTLAFFVEAFVGTYRSIVTIFIQPWKLVCKSNRKNNQYIGALYDNSCMSANKPRYLVHILVSFWNAVHRSIANSYPNTLLSCVLDKFSNKKKCLAPASYSTTSTLEQISGRCWPYLKRVEYILSYSPFKSDSTNISKNQLYIILLQLKHVPVRN